MTAVASAPSLQPLRRLGSGWSASDNVGQGALDSMNTAEEVTRILTTRKSPQRSNSSSTLSAAVPAPSASSESDFNNTDVKSLRDPLNFVPGEKDTWTGARNGRPLFPASKSEATVATSNGRPPTLPQAAANLSNPSPISALQQAARVVPSQKIMQTAQQVGDVRMAPPAPITSDPPAMLVLLPMNATFERKQINVPLFPEILRIGRQTNAKTIPTPQNGYFDSKVLSRQHAEVWADRNGKIWIRDVKSSNGTFVNGVRLSPESRDSEPHELRENDMLELGIDIVSEDQKSIVHHKVSAKVEHAGISTNSANVLDLNIGDIDPGSSGGLMGSILPPQQMRGRGLSQGSMSSNGRMSGSSMAGNMNGFGVQRHMNAWLSPVSIEQVVKRLGNELRQAKQQANDLHRTSDFFNAVLDTEPGKEIPKPPANILPPPPPPQQMNGIISPKRADPMSPYSQPPAPPPQQPLPEKPDGSRSIMTDASQQLSMKQSPTQVDIASSQILTLAEALATTRKELESQGTRVQYLEELLMQERKARENAEQRAKQLLTQSRLLNGMENGDVIELPSPSSEDALFLQKSGKDDSDARSIASHDSEDTLMTPESSIADEVPVDGRSPESVRTLLQDRLALVLREMDEMKGHMEKYRRRAEDAESERDSLADMVEQIRKKASPASRSGFFSFSSSSSSSSNLKDAGFQRGQHGSADNDNDNPSHPPPPIFSNGSVNGSHILSSMSQSVDKRGNSGGGNGPRDTNGVPTSPREQLRMLQGAMATAFSEARGSGDGAVMMQAAPYASILGVVLLGVGLMAYLNSWQKVET